MNYSVYVATSYIPTLFCWLNSFLLHYLWKMNIEIQIILLTTIDCTFFDEHTNHWYIHWCMVGEFVFTVVNTTNYLATTFTSGNKLLWRWCFYITEKKVQIEITGRRKIENGDHLGLLTARIYIFLCTWHHIRWDESHQIKMMRKSFEN